MASYPPPNPRTPQQAAEHRAYMIRTVLWLAAIPPALFALMVFGYSDQAPTFLREATVQLDTMFGQPVWSIIGPAPK